jgi:hypothetical protein
VALRDLGNLVMAKKSFETVLKIDSNNEEAKNHLKALNKID